MLVTAFTLLGASVTWLEVLAFWLALACVICNTLEIHWGWPLAIASSALYAWLFWASRLYGDVAVQVYFVVTSTWGWWAWLFVRRDAMPDTARCPDATPAAATAPAPARARAERPAPAAARLHVARLGTRQRLGVALLWVLLWPAAGMLLARYTDTDVPYFDAFPTVGSLIGQVLLGFKYLESWPVWLLVNAISIGLYAYKALWLTALLYGIFAVLAAVGWWRWRAVMATAAALPAPVNRVQR